MAEERGGGISRRTRQKGVSSLGVRGGGEGGRGDGERVVGGGEGKRRVQEGRLTEADLHYLPPQSTDGVTTPEDVAYWLRLSRQIRLTNKRRRPFVVATSVEKQRQRISKLFCFDRLLPLI